MFSIIFKKTLHFDNSIPVSFDKLLPMKEYNFELNIELFHGRDIQILQPMLYRYHTRPVSAEFNKVFAFYDITRKSFVTVHYQ